MWISVGGVSVMGVSKRSPPGPLHHREGHHRGVGGVIGREDEDK